MCSGLTLFPLSVVSPEFVFYCFLGCDNSYLLLPSFHSTVIVCTCVRLSDCLYLIVWLTLPVYLSATVSGCLLLFCHISPISYHFYAYSTLTVPVLCLVLPHWLSILWLFKFYYVLCILPYLFGPVLDLVTKLSFAPLTPCFCLHFALASFLNCDILCVDRCRYSSGYMSSSLYSHFKIQANCIQLLNLNRNHDQTAMTVIPSSRLPVTTWTKWTKAKPKCSGHHSRGLWRLKSFLNYLFLLLRRTYCFKHILFFHHFIHIICRYLQECMFYMPLQQSCS